MAAFLHTVKKGILDKVHQTSDAGLPTVLVQGKRFTIVRPIGEGAFSTVFLCHNAEGAPGIPSQVAIKRMHVPRDALERAHTEMELVQSLDHRHITRCYAAEIARADGAFSVSMVLEYCPVSLLQRMRELETRSATLPVSEALAAFASMVSAVAHLHAQDPPIAHRDLKLENCIATDSGVYKLCDFGSVSRTARQCRGSRDAAQVHEDAERFTTLAYRAPELVDPWRRHRIDEKVDVWALGVFLYFALFSRMPFPETTLAILNGHFKFPPAPQVHSDLQNIVERCLVQNPADRWDVFALQRFVAASLAFQGTLAKVQFTNRDREPNSAPQPLAPAAEPSEGPIAPAPRQSGAAAHQPAAGGDLFNMLQWSATPEEGAAAPAAPSCKASTLPSQRQLEPSCPQTDLFAQAPQQTPAIDLFAELEGSGPWPTDPPPQQIPEQRGMPQGATSIDDFFR